MRTELVIDTLAAAEPTRGGPAEHGSDRFQRGQRRCGSFNAAFKRETRKGRQGWSNEHEARLDAFRWLTRYNTRRRHSRLGQRSPIAYENDFQRAASALAQAA
ncbi:integrase core domain-containing protein [Streptomyces sp. NY05-11A]|uniref:integrase core domain-containing protein n=1 Tax=Streptomyces soliscabiei TaxID=588897 RepID=UPI0039F735BB